MREDPIVKVVHKAGNELAKNAYYDLHTFIQNLKKMRENGKLK